MWFIRAIDTDGKQHIILANSTTARVISHVLANFGLPAQLFPVEVCYSDGMAYVISPLTEERVYFDHKEVMEKGYAEAKPSANKPVSVTNTQ